MARLLAFDAVFFLLPFVVYGVWLVFTRGSFGSAADWTARTISYLAIGGALIMAGALVIFISFTGGAPGSHYLPAHVENGRIVPGRFE